MKLIFCDSFSYASLSDRAECISFPMPVVISGVRVVADKATAHASLPTPAESRPVGFRLEVCAAPFSHSDDAQFAPVLTLYDCGRTDALHALHPPLVTDRLVVRGAFEAMTFCVYGERPVRSVRTERLPLEELDPRHLSEAALLALAEAARASSPLRASVEDVAAVKREELTDDDDDDDDDAAGAFVRRLDEAAEQPALRRPLLARLAARAADAAFAAAFAARGGLAALVGCAARGPTPSVLGAVLDAAASLLRHPPLIGAFLSPDPRGGDSAYRLLAHLLSTRASAAAAVVAAAEAILLRCHVFEHCTNLARATEETVQAASAQAAHTPISQSLESLARLLCLLRSASEPSAATASSHPGPPPPPPLTLPPHPLPPWLPSLLRSLKLLPTTLLLLASPRLREQPTRLAAVYQAVRDLTLLLLASHSGTVYLASEARALIPLLRLLDDRTAPAELATSLLPLPVLRARPDRCNASLLVALTSAHLSAYAAAAAFVAGADLAGSDFSGASSALLVPLQSLLHLSRSQLGRHAVVSALQAYDGERTLFAVLQRGRAAVDGLLLTATLSLLVPLSQSALSALTLFRLYTPNTFAGLESLPLADLRLTTAPVAAFLAAGSASLALPLPDLLSALRDSASAGPADRREAAALCLRALLEGNGRTNLAEALRLGLGAVLTTLLVAAAASLSALLPPVPHADLRAWLSTLAATVPLVRHAPHSVPLRTAMLTLYAALASLPCSPLDLDLTVAGPPRDVLPDLALVLSVLGAIKEQFQDWIRIEAAERKVATLLSLLDDLCIPRSGPAIVSLLSSVLAAAPLSPSRVPPRLFEAEAERAALGAVAWLTVSARTTFVAAMRLLSYAASLAPSAATAAVKALKTALPAPSSASTGDDSIAHRVAFAALVLTRSENGRAALLTCDGASWLCTWLSIPSLRSLPLALAALTALLPHLSEDTLPSVVSASAAALSAATEARLTVALAALLARASRRAAFVSAMAQHQGGVWLSAAAERVASTLGQDGALDTLLHLACVGHALKSIAPDLSVAIQSRLSSSLATLTDAGPLKPLAERALTGDTAVAEAEADDTPLPWDMYVDALPEEYFGSGASLDAALGQEVQRAPDTKPTDSTALSSSLGKRSMSESGDSSGDRKKSAAEPANSVSVFASVVAYTTAARPKADAFRNRRPNTSRQPSRHVDDFVRPKAPEAPAAPAPAPHAREERRYDFREPMPSRERLDVRDIDMMQSDSGRYGGWARDFAPPPDVYAYPPRPYDEAPPPYPERYIDDPYWRPPPAQPSYRSYY